MPRRHFPGERWTPDRGAARASVAAHRPRRERRRPLRDRSGARLMETRRQGEALFSFSLVLVGTVVVVQLWLVAASMEALLARDFDILMPAALGSLGCFAVNAALLLPSTR